MEIKIDEKLLDDLISFEKSRGYFQDINTTLNNLILSELRNTGSEKYNIDSESGCRSFQLLFDVLNNNIWGKSWQDRSRFVIKLLCFDINNFKAFIDVKGLSESSIVIKEIGNYPSDNVFRYGGDEFVIMLDQDAKIHIPAIENIYLKYSVLNISGIRSQHRNHHILSFIKYQIQRAVFESSVDGNNIDEFIDAKG
jgi:GGDEF domain-containing protein